MACSLVSGESIKEEYLSCTICHEIFSEESYLPRNLDCGHTLCSGCINSVIQSDFKHCPECRKVITVKSASDLPICYIALRIARNVCTPMATNEVLSANEEEGIPESSPEANIDFKISNSQSAVKLKNISMTVEEVFAPNYFKQLTERSTHLIESFGDKINDCKRQLTENQHGVELITSLISAEEERISKLTELRNILKNVDERIKSMEKISELDDLMDEVLEVKEDAEKLLKQDDRICVLESFNGSKAIEKFDRCRELYAVHEQEGLKKYARVSLCGSTVLLHCLRALPQPKAGSAIMRYRPLRSQVPGTAKVSLYMFWANAMQGVIKFSVSNCKHGRHFLRLCTGEHSKSFLNKILFESCVGDTLVSHKDLSGPFMDSDYGSGCSANTDSLRFGLLLPFRQPAESLGKFVVQVREATVTEPVHSFGRCIAGSSVLHNMFAEKLFSVAIVKDCAVTVNFF